jgi:uncharacterized protein YndB with AHSA1/START domain
MKVTDPPIVVEQTFNVATEELWEALTDREQMIQWFFENIEAFEPTVGFQTRFVVENEGRVFPHLWTITVVEPLRKITYNWKYEGYAGDSFVTFEIIKEEKNTRLRLVHTITEDFPKNIPEFTKESCIAGWDYFIRQRLKDYLASKDNI